MPRRMEYRQHTNCPDLCKRRSYTSIYGSYHMYSYRRYRLRKHNGGKIDEVSRKMNAPAGQRWTKHPLQYSTVQHFINTGLHDARFAFNKVTPLQQRTSKLTAANAARFGAEHAGWHCLL